MDNKSSKKYKRYLEPNCDTQDRKVPRRTKYRQRVKSCKSANGLKTTPTICGEAACSDSNDAIQDISILTENNDVEDISVYGKSGEDILVSKEDIQHNEGDILSTDGDVQQVEDNVLVTDGDIQYDEDFLVTNGDIQQVEDNILVSKEDIQHNEGDILSTDGDVQQVEDNVLVTDGDIQHDEDFLVTSGDIQQVEDSILVTDDALQQDNLNDKHQINISICRKDILTLILAFSLRYQVSDTAIVSLIEMVNIILGKQFINPSLYHLWKTFNCNKEKMVKTHFFCEKCYTYVHPSENKSKTCSTCGVHVQTDNVQKSSCFMTISLEKQIKNMIHSGIINVPFIEDFNRNTKLNTQYSDINDGKMYKKLQKNTESLFLTYNFSVDGLAVFNNAKGSLWPILVTINEIPPAIRFQNVLVAGLWFGKKEPKMDLYMKPFVEEAIKLAENGISLAPHYKDTLKVFPACCCADSVARPCIQNSTQFNGYYGCSWCKHPGFIVNGTVKYIYKDHLLYADRTDKETLKLMHDAMDIGKSVLGMKGPSVLLPVPFFSVISNFVPDYMHGILLGVTKYLVNAWFDSRNNSREFYLGLTAICSIINERMQKIILPHNVGRVPRSLYERSLYKASEWKNFLLYMCFPCLKGILKQPYLDHISLLAGALHLLIKKSITMDDLKCADELLMKFVTETQALYGEEFMTYNMHLLLHFTTSVANWGPLWCHSMFVYEGYNATLQSFIMGTCGIKTQAIKRFLLNQELLTNKKNYPAAVSNYITKINCKSNYHKKITSVGNCNLYGAPCMKIKDICAINFPTGFLMQNQILENGDIHFFKRMTIENMLFTVKSNKQFKTCDSFIYTDSEIGQILFIALHRNSCKIVVCINKYDIVTKVNKYIDNMYTVRNSKTFKVVDVNEVIGKCTEYDNGNELITISKVPVSYELCT